MPMISHSASDHNQVGGVLPAEMPGIGQLDLKRNVTETWMTRMVAGVDVDGKRLPDIGWL